MRVKLPTSCFQIAVTKVMIRNLLFGLFLASFATANSSEENECLSATKE